MNNRLVKKGMLQKRHRAERRFRRYGKCAIAFALLVMACLLFTIVEKGWRAFLHTEIRLDLAIDAQDFPSSSLRHADFSPYIRKALSSSFPEVTGRDGLRELTNLVSSGGVQEIRNAVIADPGKLQSPFTLWISASDIVDGAVKSGIHKNTPHSERRISDRQLAWLDALRKNGAVRLVFNPYFFTTGDSREPELAGFMGSIAGSLFTLLACIAIAFPVGVMAAIYLEEFAGRNRITDIIELNITNLAAVPSIVFGLLGLSVYINLFGLPRSAPVVGGLTLALMILPTIIIATRASLRAVPDSIRDAARGLGASKLQVVMHHTLPLAIPGIMTGTILGLARAMGETAPLLMIGMVAFVADLPHSPFEPATAMPVQIYLWATSPEGSFVEKTNAGILVLLVMLALLNSAAMMIRKRYTHKW